jgi:hypothetical protein
MAVLRCKGCGRSLPKTGARVPATTAGETFGYTCEDCAYTAAHPDAVRLPPPKRVDRKHPQRESLLDLLDPFDAARDARSEARYEDDPRAEPQSEPFDPGAGSTALEDQHGSARRDA